MEKLVVEIKNNNYKKVIKKTRKILNICDNENKKLDIIKEEDIELPKNKKEEEKIQELTIDDFLNDFKL